MKEKLDNGKIPLLLSFFNDYKTREQAAQEIQRDLKGVMADTNVLLSYNHPYLLMIKRTRKGYAFKLSPKARKIVCEFSHNGNHNHIVCPDDCETCQHNPTIKPVYTELKPKSKQGVQ